MSNTLEDQIKQASTDALLKYMAVYRALKINKDMAIKIMEELDRRQQNGEVIDLKDADDVVNIFRTVGKGHVAKVASVDQMPDVLAELKAKGIPAVKVDSNLIHLGTISQDRIKEVLEVTGVLDVDQDRKVVEDVVARSKVSTVGKDAG
jgi:hypothetical protein